ncbi:hypothetical protein RFI_15001 [Reticulomyxa filosa]|uniref:Uncharacterized protein n=1 Tax=Reticulomyxa filosa TaxID=46433 RepID=X6N7D6_RETFI|nr:hypothetical protein RFI_15001 [Reticulomyxa filosa]|eukprot:ETO22200.1 hypothetical protein RFI_15001 [Reticulomyxa filosa]
MEDRECCTSTTALAERVTQTKKLRLLMLQWVFNQTGRQMKDDMRLKKYFLKIKCLGSSDEQEKIKRYRELCPKCDALDLIRSGDKDEWLHITHQNSKNISAQLNEFVSVSAKKGNISVIQNSVLQIQVHLTQKIQNNLLTRCHKKGTIKVLKSLWFEKIRNATVYLFTYPKLFFDSCQNLDCIQFLESKKKKNNNNKYAYFFS